MPLDLNNPQTWISHLLENLPGDKLSESLKDDNPEWEFIEGEIVKLGSLAHSQLDIPDIQRRGWCCWRAKAKISACWRTCSEPFSMRAIRCWRCACWLSMSSTFGPLRPRKIWRIKSALPGRS